ncbi:enoyl-CoA hydratase/isomerase family protein [Streptococcus danieliae]|uniref:Enoyl-CoA hydratase/isomerase family protein n=1 Tax=Streptococcus danieliae TaxID=747656 RepID=A0A7Z0M7A2_9STRE|nr:enoyl-CoA hydratase/isomerase family protein [Streptococcus danieliae]NYS97194.1 enoyl-CoA hydratase/isomerase family protein [Streptococcus danieliae]
MTYYGILMEKTDGLAKLTLNRPEVANRFNVPMCDSILAALADVAQDQSLKALVIEAVGKVFSVGGDLVQMKEAVDNENIESLVRIAEQVNEISLALKALGIPVIMVVDGPVAGAAFNLVLYSFKIKS